jgi:hypothetical protein
MTNEPLIARLGRLAGTALRVSTWLWGLAAFGCVFLTTLATDEAWVLNGLRSYLRPAVQDLSSEPIVTNGGLFALANLALERAFGSRVWVHRLFSVGCLLVLVAIVSWLGRRRQRPIKLDYLAIAPLLAVPGTAEVGTAALGTSTAVALLVLASALWSGSSAPGMGRILLCGLLFGLGAASRFDLVLFAPALLLVSSIRLDERSRPRLQVPWQALAATGVGLVLFAANQVLMARTAHGIVESRVSSTVVAASTGFSGYLLDYPKQLNRLMVGLGFASPGLLALASAAPFWRTGGAPPDSDAARRLAILILVTAWILWLGWILRAPIPHLRYLWPSLALFAIVGGMGLSTLYARYAAASDSRMALLCQFVALGFVLGGLAGTSRSLVMGESDYLAWEWSREMGTDYFRRFQHVQDQRSAAAYLRNRIPHDATVFSYIPFALRYLADRPVVSAGDTNLSGPRGRKTYLVLTPAVGTYLYLCPEAFGWIERHGRLEAQFGRYSFYELPDGPPSDGSLLRVSRTNYERHPLSRAWFGHDPPVPASSGRDGGTGTAGPR